MKNISARPCFFFSTFYTEYPTKLHPSRALNINYIITSSRLCGFKTAQCVIVYKFLSVAVLLHPNCVMWYLAVIITVIYSAYSQQNNLLQECAKYYRPKNYLELLPNINMPYVDQLPVPNNVPNLRNKEYLNKIQNIVPSPAMTTKVLTVKTKYIYKNPVCVKYSKKQKLCKPEDGQIREHVDKLITKDYFVQNNIEERVDGVVDVISDENYVDEDRFSLKVSFDRLGKYIFL